MRKIIILSAIMLGLTVQSAGATDANVFRTFERNGTISLLNAEGRPVAPPANMVLRTETGRPHRWCSYPWLAARWQQEGKVLLSMRITRDGYVTGASLAVPNSHERLNEASLTCVRHWQYKPARVDGVAVETQHMVEIIWRIDHS